MWSKALMFHSCLMLLCLEYSLAPNLGPKLLDRKPLITKSWVVFIHHRSDYGRNSTLRAHSLSMYSPNWDNKQHQQKNIYSKPLGSVTQIPFSHSTLLRDISSINLATTMSFSIASIHVHLGPALVLLSTLTVIHHSS